MRWNKKDLFNQFMSRFSSVEKATVTARATLGLYRIRFMSIRKKPQEMKDCEAHLFRMYLQNKNKSEKIQQLVLRIRELENELNNISREDI